MPVKEGRQQIPPMAKRVILTLVTLTGAVIGATRGDVVVVAVCLAMFTIVSVWDYA